MGDNRRGAYVDALVHVFATQVGVEGFLSPFLANTGLAGVGLLHPPPHHRPPTREEHLAALTQHVHEVELAVGVLVVREILREIQQHAEDRQLCAKLAHHKSGSLLHGGIYDEFSGACQREQAAQVVLHDTYGDAFTVDGVELSQRDVEEDGALVDIGHGGCPFHRSEICQHVPFRRVDAEECLPF